MTTRRFEILAFIVRNGKLFRMDRRSCEFESTMDNIPALIAHLCRVQYAQGRSVLVLEEGCVKPDWCRMTVHSQNFLAKAFGPDDCRRLLRNVEIMQGTSFQDFTAHLHRSFNMEAVK